jgi:hypothetical protein
MDTWTCLLFQPDHSLLQCDRHGLGPGAHTELMLDIVVFREDWACGRWLVELLKQAEVFISCDAGSFQVIADN